MKPKKHKKSATAKNIDAINRYLQNITNIWPRVTKKSLEFSISNDHIKYCYKADNFYDFERRYYLLINFIERKIIQELNAYEAKKA